MTTDRHGARRAALVLNLLRSSAVSSYRYIEGELREELDDVEDHDDRSIERIRRRAVDDLQLWGVPIVDKDGALSIDRSNLALAERARLHVTQAQADLRDEIAGWLRLLDPDHQVDRALIEKVHMRDRLAFTYGTPPQEWVGIPYLLRHGERPALLVRTTSGDHGFWSDAIRTMTVLVPNADDVLDGDPDAQVIDASRVTGSWKQRRGRPHDVVTLRRAQRMVAAIRTLVAPDPRGSDADTTVSFRDVARRTTEKLAAVRSLAPLVQSLDPNIYDEEDHFVVERSSGGAELDGAEALIARLEVGAVLALTDRPHELSPSFPDANLHVWRDLLDEFLSRASIRDVVERTACGPELVAAALESDTLDAVIVLNGERRRGLLEVSGLHWHRLRWWVDGQFDGLPLDKAELPVVDVLETDEP